METEGEEKIIFRVVTIGDSSVGKTCIIKRFLRNNFDMDEPNTVGAIYDSFTKDFKGRKIEIQIWDTAGQEQYRSLGPVYFRYSAGALLVFDITNPETFKNLDEWYDSFRSVCGDNPVVFLVGNKKDLPEDRKIQSREAKEWANIHNSTYIETSARTGEGIDLLFDNLVETIGVVNFEEHAGNTIARKGQKLNESGEKSSCC